MIDSEMTQVLIVGGGMITHDQILPSLYHMQRQSRIGEIGVCASRPETVRRLAAAETLLRAFPGQRFCAYPESGSHQPDLFRELIGRMPPGQVVVVAVPDHLHFDVIMTALRHNQHVCSVKPLVLTHREAQQIQREAFLRGLVVGIEYHKRFDDRNLLARRKYREGWFGDFRLGRACLIEKWYYRDSNFQSWMTLEKSDAFSYIGCHYVDLVHFITGLSPVAISVYGIREKFPNANEGFLWTDARVIWNNGACLNVQNGLGFPDDAPGSNTQGLTLYCHDGEKAALLSHSDQYRGLKYCYERAPADSGATIYTEPNPDYFQYVDVGGPGLVPVGYGYRSIEFIISACLRVSSQQNLSERQKMLRELDEQGIMATPANSGYNELVLEAGRRSLSHSGREEAIAVPDSGDSAG